MIIIDYEFFEPEFDVKLMLLKLIINQLSHHDMHAHKHTHL